MVASSRGANSPSPGGPSFSSGRSGIPTASTCREMDSSPALLSMPSPTCRSKDIGNPTCRQPLVRDGPFGDQEADSSLTGRGGGDSHRGGSDLGAIDETGPSPRPSDWL